MVPNALQSIQFDLSNKNCHVCSIRILKSVFGLKWDSESRSTKKWFTNSLKTCHPWSFIDYQKFA